MSEMTAFDLQLNGYKGIDFNADDLSADDLVVACDAVLADGGGQMLATVITDRVDRMVARVSRLAELRSVDHRIAEVLTGIHLEGPFINPRTGYVGAHPVEHALPASISVAAQLVEAGQGLVRLVTLAPECDANLQTTSWLVDHGVRVSAGHCDPSTQTLDQAIDAGLTAFTHLGNGCPAQLHRHDNILWRVLATDRLRWVMLIADGVHLPATLIRTMIRAIGIERVIAVSDATAAGGMGPGTFSLAGRDVIVDESGAAWAADRTHLVGSTASPNRLREVLCQGVGLSAQDAQRVMVANPAQLLGQELPRERKQ